MTNNPVIQRFIDFFVNFDLTEQKVFDAIYTEDVVFIDPFHKVEGRHNLYNYFKRLMSRVTTCRFEITDVTENNGSAYVAWVMIFSHPAIEKGEEVELKGVSHLNYSDKISSHRDYFDTAELLYRRLPVLGSVIRMIENRM